VLASLRDWIRAVLTAAAVATAVVDVGIGVILPVEVF